MVQITSSTLGSPGTFDITSIPATYNDLLIVLIARGARVSGSDLIAVRFNNDSGANYDTQEAVGASTTVSAVRQSGVTAANVGWVPASTATANWFSSCQMYVAGYASTSNIKTINTLCQAWEPTASNLSSEAYVAQWNATPAAINRVTVFGQTTANFLAGSSIRVYGIT